jgi:hypothetical protein
MGFSISQANANKILGVCGTLYGLALLFATDAFWAQYFSAKSLHTAPDMLNWFSRGWAFVLLSMGISSYQHCNGFGISFFNLVSQVFYTVYFAGMVFGAGIGAEEKTFADTKQMWQLQLGINVIFLAIAYLGHADATKNGQADSEKAHNEGETDHKTIGGYAFHQSGCNKFLGAIFGIYGLLLAFYSKGFFLHYWTEAVLDRFALFLFFAQGWGLMFIAVALASWTHNGGDGISQFHLYAQPLFLINFIYQVFGHGYNDNNWSIHKNMWYAQVVLNGIFTVVAYLGNKDAQARRPAAAATDATPATPAGGGSML